MNRRIFSLLLPLSLLLSLGVQAAVTDIPRNDPPGVYWTMDAEEGALLTRNRIYTDQFADVPADSWYYEYAALGYEYGLFDGREDGFAPGAEITVAELLTLSARLRAAYEGDIIPERGEGELWYAPYVSYLAEKNLMANSLISLDVPATRAQLAGIFALSLPESCYSGLNDALIADAYASGKYIADVDDHTPYQTQILWLYRQGLLQGMDNAGSYRPDSTTTRAETAALVTRIVDPSLRITLDWVIPPAWSLADVSFASLVASPESVNSAPAYNDAAAIDALVRRMLASNQHTIGLQYPRPITASDAQALVNAFAPAVKRYCEQMYNTVECRYYLNSGMVHLDFYASSCMADAGIRSASDNRDRIMRSERAAAQLSAYRDAVLAKAVAVHDLLWESGQISADMSQYDVAKVYFQWLCDNCEYDRVNARNESAHSHIAYSALIDGKAVCDGYTGAYNLFLKLEGIDCYALANNTHIWTVATLDGTEYHIDATWGDQDDRVEWSYFGMSEAASRQAHPW